MDTTVQATKPMTQCPFCGGCAIEFETTTDMQRNKPTITRLVGRCEKHHIWAYQHREDPWKEQTPSTPEGINGVLFFSLLALFVGILVGIIACNLPPI